MLKVNGQAVELGHFPDSTLLLKGEGVEPQGSYARIEWRFESNEELVALQFLVGHLRDNGVVDLDLQMHYIPNARQDRVKTNTDVFTLKHFANIINAMDFDIVEVLDPHSKVSIELLNNAIVKTPQLMIQLLLNRLEFNDNKDKSIVFYPDKGAKERYDVMSNFPNIAYGEKVREWETGNIIGLDIVGCLPPAGFDVLIVDDICSFGGTFYHSAKKLKDLGANKIYLFVSHCEDSILKGELLKGDLIEKVYTTNSLYRGKHEKVVVLNGFDFNEVNTKL